MNDLITYAFKNLKKRMLRSSLTVLSILVGIMAIFILVSFGQGLSNYMSETFDELGADKLIALPRGGFLGAGSAFFFTDDEITVVERTPGVRSAAGMSYDFTEAQRSQTDAPVGLIAMGLPTTGREGDLARDMFPVDIVEGRYLRNNERDNVVVGYSFSQPNRVFERAISVGERIFVRGREMRVIGIFGEMGNPEDDRAVYMDINIYAELFNKENRFEYIYIQAQPNTDVDRLRDEIARRLRRHLDQEEGHEEFFVQTFQSLLESYGNIILVINSIVTMIALISVVVAGINTTNTMYTSVLERTQEIGVMKAIGAKNSDILKIFLFESGTLGLIGGFAGIVLGYLAASAGGIILAQIGYSILQPFFPWWLWVGSLIFAITVGTLSGILPAMQASKQNPVDALRYE